MGPWSTPKEIGQRRLKRNGQAWEKKEEGPSPPDAHLFGDKLLNHIQAVVGAAADKRKVGARRQIVAVVRHLDKGAGVEPPGNFHQVAGRRLQQKRRQCERWRSPAQQEARGKRVLSTAFSPSHLAVDLCEAMDRDEGRVEQSLQHVRRADRGQLVGVAHKVERGVLGHLL